MALTSSWIFASLKAGNTTSGQAVPLDGTGQAGVQGGGASVTSTANSGSRRPRPLMTCSAYGWSLETNTLRMRTCFGHSSRGT